jgi:hypothetical protein
VNSRRLAHINYKALPYICKAVTGLPELKGDHEGVCNGCAQGKNIKNPFSKRGNKAEGVLELIHSNVCGPIPSSSINGDVGIKREIATPYNPQQNVVAERKNGTTMEAVKTMIHDQNLPMCLWEEVAMETIYVQNRLSHNALGLKTPEEMFTRKKPEVSHLKNIWLSSVYSYTEREKKKVGTLWKEGNICGML